MNLISSELLSRFYSVMGVRLCLRLSGALIALSPHTSNPLYCCCHLLSIFSHFNIFSLLTKVKVKRRRRTPITNNNVFKPKWKLVFNYGFWEYNLKKKKNKTCLHKRKREKRKIEFSQIELCHVNASCCLSETGIQIEECDILFEKNR